MVLTVCTQQKCDRRINIFLMCDRTNVGEFWSWKLRTVDFRDETKYSKCGSRIEIRALPTCEIKLLVL